MKYSAHPPTVHLPVGLLIGSNIFDTVYLIVSDPVWQTISYNVLLTGLLSVVPALITGVIELLSIDSGKERELKTALYHMSLMCLSALLYFAAFIVRKQGELTYSNFVITYSLQSAGLILLTPGGWLGGKLVYKYKIGAER